MALLIVLYLFAFNVVSAKDYYFSSSSPGNAGTSVSPYPFSQLTQSKINFMTGDKIFLKSGDVFAGEIPIDTKVSTI